MVRSADVAKQEYRWGWVNSDEPFNPEKLKVYVAPLAFFDVREISDSEELPHFVRYGDISDFLVENNTSSHDVQFFDHSDFVALTKNCTEKQMNFFINRVNVSWSNSLYFDRWDQIAEFLNVEQMARLIARTDFNPALREHILIEFLSLNLESTGKAQFKKVIDQIELGAEKLAAGLYARGIDVNVADKAVEQFTGVKPKGELAISAALAGMSHDSFGPRWKDYQPILAAIKAISPTPKTEMLIAIRMAELIPTENVSAANIRNVSEIEQIINTLDAEAQKYFYDQMLEKIDLTKIADVSMESDLYFRFAISLYVRREQQNAIALFTDADLRKIIAHMFAPEVYHTFKGLFNPELVGEAMVDAIAQSYRKKSDLYTSLFSYGNYDKEMPQDVIDFRDKVALAFAKSYINQSYTVLDPTEEYVPYNFVRGRQGVTRFLDEWGDHYFDVRTEHNAAIADFLYEHGSVEDRIRLATLGCLTDERSDAILKEAAITYAGPNAPGIVADYAKIADAAGIKEVFNGFTALQARQAATALLEQTSIVIDGV